MRKTKIVFPLLILVGLVRVCTALAESHEEIVGRKQAIDRAKFYDAFPRSHGNDAVNQWRAGAGTKQDVPNPRATGPSVSVARPLVTGTGFFITDDGYVLTNAHVIKEGATVQIVTRAGITRAKVVKLDRLNDLALLKADGIFPALAVVTSRMVRLGSTVATVGFPNVGLQGFAPKLAKGEIAALSGVQDDARYFQISVPLQPGNSGGPLVDSLGNVVGIVTAKLSASAALATSGTLPENVNYAVKGSFVLGFLESLPAVTARLKSPNASEQKFEDSIKSAEQAAVLVLVSSAE